MKLILNFLMCFVTFMSCFFVKMSMDSPFGQLVFLNLTFLEKFETKNYNVSKRLAERSFLLTRNCLIRFEELEVSAHFYEMYKNYSETSSF